MALGRPADQADPAARFAHPNHLAGGELMERREHHADRRHHHIEFVVPERQFVGVGLTPFEVDATLSGRRPTAFQQLRAQVAGDDAGSGLCGGNRGVSGACGHVEHSIARSYAGGLHQHRAQGRDEIGGEFRVVAGRPHGAVFGGHRLDVHGWGGVAHGRCPSVVSVQVWSRRRPRGSSSRSVPSRRPASALGRARTAGPCILAAVVVIDVRVSVDVLVRA